MGEPFNGPVWDFFKNVLWMPLIGTVPVKGVCFYLGRVYDTHKKILKFRNSTYRRGESRSGKTAGKTKCGLGAGFLSDLRFPLDITALPSAISIQSLSYTSAAHYCSWCWIQKIKSHSCLLQEFPEEIKTNIKSFVGRFFPLAPPIHSILLSKLLATNQEVEAFHQISYRY